MSKSAEWLMWIKSYEYIIGKVVTEAYQLMQVVFEDAIVNQPWVLSGYVISKWDVLKVMSGLDTHQSEEMMNWWLILKWQKIDCLWNGWRGKSFSWIMTASFNWRLVNKAYLMMLKHLDKVQWSSYWRFQKQSLRGASSTDRNGRTSVYMVMKSDWRVLTSHPSKYSQYLHFHKFGIHTFRLCHVNDISSLLHYLFKVLLL
jgi:hypothetical protein